jgi:hypothetical protein
MSCPGGYLLIEHLPDARIPRARAAVWHAAEEAGVTWET